ncbi:echinoderm microtubule-associated protein-like 1 [Xyrauchen texanus]|uniref:echinoderm microtubule-associated protein-like 1 n=1 Tax=Xyrauchen texanus TaxID=154827 RepID=UPI002242BAC8|nr:echinoderm microtubule-associated protein-like 1 [Xyrauchen texanus]
MEDLMERCEDEGARQTDSYNSESLLAPDSDFISDDQSCHVSGLDVCDVCDRLTFLEQRVQMQEDEIQLLKMTIADVLKRLNISQEQTSALPKRATNKVARPASSSLRKISSSTLPPSPSLKNCSPSPASQRTGSAKDSPSASASGKTQTTTNTTTCKKLEIKPKDASSSIVGATRVTHCKVTMQIYLSRLSRRTGSDPALSTTLQPDAANGPPAADTDNSKAAEGRNAATTVLLQKSPCQTPSQPPDPKLQESRQIIQSLLPDLLLKHKTFGLFQVNT